MIAEIARNARALIQDNSPAILTGLGIAGVFTTTILAVKATPEALRRVWDAETEHNRDISRWEKAKLVWPLYVPAATSAVTTTVCIFGANQISSKRTAVAMSALSISESSYREYREKTKHVVGDKREAQIRTEIAQDDIVAHPNTTLIVSNDTKMACYDKISGRYFESDYEALRKAENDVNQRALHEDAASLNDFYSRLGIPTIEIGDELGWNPDYFCTLVLTPVMDDLSKKPVVHISFEYPPKLNYDRIWR